MSKILVAYFSRAGENYFGGAIKSVAVGNTAVSYTHLDVYKRQTLRRADRRHSKDFPRVRRGDL